MKKFTFSLLLLFVAFAIQLHGQGSLSIQGVIKNADGSAVTDGNYPITFSLYNVETGGSAIWTETQDAVEVTGGIYSVLLGESTPLTASFNEAYYLGVAIDGGAELIPRAQLTSSPYALALIGTSNVFGSSGSVGIGTTSPTEDLHVVGDVKIEGDIEVTGGLTIPGLNAVGVSSPAGSNAIYNSTSNTNGHFFKVANNNKMYILNDEIRMEAPLRVTGKFSSFGLCNGCYQYQNNGQIVLMSGGNVSSVAIDTDAGWVASTGYYTNSDRRIKTALSPSVQLSDLNLLNQLKVTDYKHIDNRNGDKLVKGFIAQEVKEVLPDVIGLTTRFIPSVYAKPTSVKLENEQLYLELEKEHGLKEGDKVRIYDANGEEDFTVSSVISETAFRVDNWTKPAEFLFVYGKEVDDFHNIDFKQLTALNISATQELARQVEELKEENAKLREQKDRLSSMLNQILGRIYALENPDSAPSEHVEISNE